MFEENVKCEGNENELENEWTENFEDDTFNSFYLTYEKSIEGRLRIK